MLGFEFVTGTEVQMSGDVWSANENTVPKLSAWAIPNFPELDIENFGKAQ